MTELSEARRRANKKWDDENKERKRYIQKKSVARSFVKNDATPEDLKELHNMIQARLADES